MERPVWSGALVFGIVTIPIRMMAATRDHDIHFHQISRTDRKRIRYLKVAEGSDEEVAADDIVKGYEVKDGQYVVFDEDELAKLAARKSKVIDITSFVALSEIDPLFFDRPYRLLPGEQGVKPYRLLHETLERTQRVGIAQMVMHGKEHIVAVRSLPRGLIAHTLRFADEIVDGGGGGGGKGGKKASALPAGPKLAEREVAMAEKLVESMHDAFDPADFTDDYRARLQTAIARKARGKTIAIDEEEDRPEQGNVISLMDALQRSLDKRGAAKAPAAKAPAKKRTVVKKASAKASRRRAG